MRKIAIVVALLLGGALGQFGTGAAWGGEIVHGSPTGKYAVGFASYLNRAEFRISADCPASPDRHTQWWKYEGDSLKTGNCAFNWTITKSYFGLRAL